MSPSWLANLCNRYGSLKEHASKQDQNLEIHDKQSLASIEMDEISEAEMNAIVINKPVKSLFDSDQFVVDNSVEVTYNSTRQYAKKYFASFPGHDTLANNVIEHVKLRELLKNPESSFEEIEACQTILEYRLNVMSVAEQLLLAVGIPRPKRNNKDIYPGQFDSDALEMFLLCQKNQSIVDKWYDILDMVVRSRLFRYPVEEQGQSWDKPKQYIAAAFFFMPDISPCIVRYKLTAMLRIVMNDTNPAVIRVMRPEEAFAGFEEVYIAALTRSVSLSKSRESLAHKSNSSSTPTPQNSDLGNSPYTPSLSDMWI